VPGLQREDDSPLRVRRAAGGRALQALRLDARLIVVLSPARLAALTIRAGRITTERW
jgi:hypothetical protein